MPSRSRTTVWCASLVATTLLFAGSVSADDSGSPATNATDDFAALVKRGDQAHASGDFLKAIDAYRDALELRDDPLVAGRLGLVLFTLRIFDAAAGNLLRAIEYGAGASDAERLRFWNAYQVAQREVCRINISIDQKNVTLEIDGEPRQTTKSDFWLFLSHGPHTLRVKLTGFEDEVKEIVAAKGGQLDVPFALRRLPEPAAPPTIIPMETASPAPISALSNVTPTAPMTNLRSRGQFVAGAGGAFVFGSTPMPAIGSQIFAAWRSRSWWEVGFDLRAAWTFVDDERFPDTRFVAWSAIVSPCARQSDRWFGCMLLQLDGLSRNDSSEAASLPGFGLRGGVELAAHERFRLQGLVDVVAHYQRFQVLNPAPWESWPVLFSLGLRGLYKL